MRLSITRRIVLLILIGSILILIAFGAVTRGIFNNILGGEVRFVVMQNFDRITDYGGSPLTLERVQKKANSLDYAVGYAGPEGVWQSDDAFMGWDEITLRSNFGPDRPFHGHGHEEDDDDDDDDHEGDRSHRREFRFPLRRGWYKNHLIFEIRQGPARVALFVDAKNTTSQFWKYIVLALGFFLAIVTLIIFGVRRITRPIRELTTAVQAIGQGNFDQRVNWSRNDELGDLGRSVDDMADQIEGMLDAKRDLLLAIAHELKTPLTRAKLLATMSDNPQIDEELDEINQVLDALLESERMGEGHTMLAPIQFNLSSDIEELMSQIDGQWQREITPDIYYYGDRNRLNVAFGNILKNAQKYGQGKPVTVRLIRDGDQVLFEVLDQGDGVSTAEMKRLTEAFSRFDASRNRESGGLGLGLYLTERIISAHNGQLSFAPNQPNGLIVRIVLPMTAKD